jgi:predicted HicB family RNase H-like nuclease
MTNVMTYKGYKARVEYDSDDECFIGHLAGVNDVVGFHATSVKDLKSAFHEAVDDYIATCKKVGKAPEKPFSGKVMFRIAPHVHADAVLAAQLAGKSLNQWAEEVLREAAKSSSKT